MVVPPGTHVCCGPGWPLGSCCPRGTPLPPPAQLHRSRSQESRVLGAEGDLVSAAAAGVQRSQHRGWGPPQGIGSAARALTPQPLHQGRSWQAAGAGIPAQKEPPQCHPPAAGSGGSASPSRCGSAGTHGSSSLSIRDKSSGLARSQSVRGQNGYQGRGATLPLGTPQVHRLQSLPSKNSSPRKAAAVRIVRDTQEPAGRSTGAPSGLSDTSPGTATTKSTGCVGCNRQGAEHSHPCARPEGNGDR